MKGIYKKIIEHLYFSQKYNLALYDQFTKVYNRNWFDVIGKNKYKDKDIFVSIVDINNLKYVNDNFGHIVGDNVILNFVNLLKDNFANKKIDILRYGGDEFILISNDNIANELLQLNNGNFSFGTVLKSSHMSIEEAIIKADKYMYNMKLNLVRLREND